ncbi:hypothetical protein SME24J_09490 [Serratia marcescens]|nr:hypothetical protein SME24J_09490 [Serratia marcescens]
MTTKQPTENKQDNKSKEIEKTCFIIMPIADSSGYDNGHFLRVYNHLIKPACEAAGFKPIRADDVSSSHFIVVDILKKIVESDLAICDLSSRNPNVLYELGLRQAFNKKTVLIKDHKTDNIFDVQGFRYAQYDSNLRIDNVKSEIIKLSLALKETYEANGDINSIVQLLQIEPARIDTKTELTASDTVIFRAIADLKESVEKLSTDSEIKSTSRVKSLDKKKAYLLARVSSLGLRLNTEYYIKNSSGVEFGKLVDVDPDGGQLLFQEKSGEIFPVSIHDPELSNIDDIPF